MVLLWIALGGALGALARYGVSGWVHSWVGTDFPWGTFVVNATGSLLIGLLLRSLEGLPWGPDVRAFFAIGLLGAFTTFSTYSYETLALLEDGEWLRAGFYSLGSLAIGLLAVSAGLALAELALQGRG